MPQSCRFLTGLVTGKMHTCSSVALPVQSVNNYDKEVFNGDPGYIMSVDAPARRVRVRYPSSGQPCSTALKFQSPVQLLAGCTGCSMHFKLDVPFSKALLIRHARCSNAAVTR